MGMLTTVSPNEPAALQSLLQTALADTGISVANDATGGTASSLPNQLDGMDGGGSAEPLRMTQAGATIVIQEHALNDALAGETVTEYTAYLGQWIQDAQSSGLTPILEEPGPVCDDSHPQLGAYVQAMDQVAATYKVPLIRQYGWISSTQGWQGHMINCTVPDSTLAGLKAKAEQAVVGPLVQNLIKG
jgi:hypothetical protein